MEALQPLSIDSFSYSWLINIKPASFDTLEGGVRLSFDAAADGDPFIEIDPRLASLRWSSGDAAYDFDFCLPGTQSPVLIHADQIFSDGLMLPLQLVTPPLLHREEAPRSSDSSDSVLSGSPSLDSSTVLLSLSNRYRSPYFYSVPGKPGSLNSPSPRRFRCTPGWPLSLDPAAKRALSRRSGTKLPFLRNCGKTSKKILHKYLCFLMPLYKKVKGLKLIWRPVVSSAIVPSESRSCASSWEGSPRSSDALTAGVDRCRFTCRVLDTGMEKSIHDAVLHCKKSIGESQHESCAQE